MTKEQFERLEKAYEILTDWLVDRSEDDPNDAEKFTLFEDIDPEIDEARSILSDLVETVQTGQTAHERQQKP